MDAARRTWAEIDLDCARHNWKHMQSRLTPGCQPMAVVKADAYGHGDGYMARLLAANGAAWFGVSSLEEAISLRMQGISQHILVFGYTPPVCARTLYEQRITQTVYSYAYAQALSDAAADTPVDCHIKLDTGMTRIGLDATVLGGESVREAAEIQALPGLRCTGIFTHLSCADECTPDSDSFTRRQFAAFMQTVDALAAQGVTFPLRHCCNSAAALRFPEMHLDLVRLGIVLYGLAPAAACRNLIPALRPVMSLYSRVAQVKTAPDGAAVSYGRTYTVKGGPRQLATVGVGYADGYRRSHGNQSRVLIHGQYAPVIGRVCMDQLMVDVTGRTDVRMGDRVVLIGTQGENCITLDDLAALDGGINYEEACLIGRRVPRVYMEQGRAKAEVNHLLHASWTELGKEGESSTCRNF